MKKWMFFFAILFLYAPNAFGDAASPDMHVITTKVMVTNLDQYPDIVLLAYADGNPTGFYVVSQNESIGSSGGFTGTFGFGGSAVRNILAVKKSVLEAAGGVGSVNLAVLKTYTPAIVINPSLIYMGNSIPLASRTYLYRITGVTANTVSLQLYQGTFTFNDGRDSRVVSY
jgi:hypothetical protein